MGRNTMVRSLSIYACMHLLDNAFLCFSNGILLSMIVSVPGFDHAKGDPEEDQHTFIRDQHKIVICEGIYLLHDDDGWENIEKFFDWTIYVEADVDSCIARLKERNKSIPGYTPEEIEERCEIVDKANCEAAHESAAKFANQIVTSGAS